MLAALAVGVLVLLAYLALLSCSVLRRRASQPAIPQSAGKHEDKPLVDASVYIKHIA
jgi:hypothetical protein